MGVTNGDNWKAGWAFGLYFGCDGIHCGLSFFFFWSTEGRAKTTHIPVQDLDLENASVQFSRSVVSDSLWPHESQHARSPCPSPTPAVHSDSRPSSQWCHPAISSSVVPSPPAPNPSQHQGLFQWVNSSHEVAKVLEFQLQHQSFQWTPRTDLL